MEGRKETGVGVETPETGGWTGGEIEAGAGHVIGSVAVHLTAPCRVRGKIRGKGGDIRRSLAGAEADLKRRGEGRAAGKYLPS